MTPRRILSPITRQFLLRVGVIVFLLFLFFLLVWVTKLNASSFIEGRLFVSKIERRRSTQFRTYYTLNDADLHYGVVIDCGSSGSRLYVFAWPTHSGTSDRLLDIRPLAAANGKHVVKKVTPGISSFGLTPEKSFEYLTPLLDFASSALPKQRLAETPLYILCTAGMRLIPQVQQDAILNNLRSGVKKNYAFAFSDTHAEVISGKQEGVYAWIATNYLLGRFNHDYHDGVPLVEANNGHLRKKTVGIIDMGGGSFQVAFEMPRKQASSLPSQDLVAEFNLGCVQNDEAHRYSLYVTTFLGYGANSARKKYEDVLVAKHRHQQNSNNSTTSYTVVHDPCLNPGLYIPTSSNLSLVGTGNYTECFKNVLPLLGRDEKCEHEPCSVQGRHQPKIDFLHTEFLGFSEYWYTMNDVLGLGGPYSYLLFHGASRKFCSTLWPTLAKHFRQRKFPKADSSRMKRVKETALKIMLMHKRFQCFKAAWITAVLHSGLQFPRIYRKFKSVSEIKGTEVQWTLGAIVYRTRYFPLREIQRRQLEEQKLKSRRSHGLSYNYQYLLLLASVLIVAFSIFRIHRHVSGLSRISSGYFA